VISPLLGMSVDLQLKVREWKETYKRVFFTTIQDDDGEKFIIYRGLTKREADMLDGEPDEILHTEGTLRLALLHPAPDELDQWSAGAAHCAYESICSSSGWGDEDLVPIMEEAGEYLETFHGGVTAFICSVLNFKPEEVYEMTAPELAKHLRIAEFAKGTPFPFQYYLDNEAWVKENGGKQQSRGGVSRDIPVPAGARVDPRAAAMAMGERSKEEILSDRSAVNFSDPSALNKMIREFNTPGG